MTPDAMGYVQCMRCSVVQPATAVDAGRCRDVAWCDAQDETHTRLALRDAPATQPVAVAKPPRVLDEAALWGGT